MIYYKVPVVEMDDEQIQQDIDKKHIDKAKIGKDLDEISVDENDDGLHKINSGVDYSFVPNVKDEQKKQADLIND